MPTREIIVVVGNDAPTFEGDERYCIIDTRGIPQCGAAYIFFDAWFELDYYLDENPDIMERISEGYAIIQEA